MYVVARPIPLEVVNIPYLDYADDIVIFYSHKDISIVSEFLNNSLNFLNNKLNVLYIYVASKKCKVVIFIRKHRYEIFPFFMNEVSITAVSKVSYLGLILDSHLRWKPHLNYVSSSTSKWYNL